MRAFRSAGDSVFKMKFSFSVCPLADSTAISIARQAATVKIAFFIVVVFLKGSALLDWIE